MKRLIKFIIIFCFIFFILQTNIFIYSRESRNKKIIVGYCQGGLYFAWHITLLYSNINEAKKRKVDFRLMITTNDKVEDQIEDIRALIDQGVDIIVFRPINTDGWKDILEEAKKANIPVIIIDNYINKKYESLYLSFIQIDFYKEGLLAAQWLIDNYKKLKKKSRSMKKINIVELRGTDNTYPADDRRRGFADVLKNHPNYEIIYSKDGSFYRSNAYKIMKEFLQNPKNKRDMHVLFAHNDDMALGAIKAIKESGLNPGKDVIIVSIDAVKGAFTAMINGELNCTVECTPYFGPKIFDVIEDYMNKKSIPKDIYVNDRVFTQETAEEDIKYSEY